MNLVYHQDIDNLYGRDHHVILLTSRKNTDIRAYQKTLVKIAEMVPGNFVDFKMMIAEKIVMQMLSEVRRGLHDIGRTFAGSNQTRLAFGTFSYKVVTKNLAKVHTMAQKRGLVPLIRFPEQIMQLHCSFASMNASLTFYVHVPLARE